MVGIFSKFSVSRAGHRRTRSALDGRIWKERVSAVGVRRTDVSAARDGTYSGGGDNDRGGSDRMKLRPQSNRMILPSMSAPEHNFLNLLEECNASGS